MTDKKIYQNTIDEWINEEKLRTCGSESNTNYLKNHNNRFQEILKICRKFNPSRKAKVLDVGRSSLTVILSKYYQDMTSIGFPLNEDIGGHREQEKVSIPHINFDLNQCKNTELWGEEKYDIIVYSEVIEHLFTAPEFTLLFFKYLLNDGGIIVCTTPNAASHYQRYKHLLGFNTYKQIRFYEKNPGHFREYTKKEMIEMGEKCELKILEHSFINFHEAKANYKDSILNLLARFVPQFRWSQIIVYQK